MTLAESQLKARTHGARGNALASHRIGTCCRPNELAASIMMRPSSGPAACSASVYGARDGHEHPFGNGHGVGDGGRVCALPEFGRQRPRPGGVPCT
jgi:hypothetical protein